MQPGWKLKEGAGEEEAKEGGNGGGGETTFFNGVLPRGGSPRAMKLVAWNCRGLNSTRAVRSLLEAQRQINLDVCLLSETHLDTAKAESVTEGRL